MANKIYKTPNHTFRRIGYDKYITNSFQSEFTKVNASSLEICGYPFHYRETNGKINITDAILGAVVSTWTNLDEGIEAIKDLFAKDKYFPAVEHYMNKKSFSPVPSFQKVTEKEINEE